MSPRPSPGSSAIDVHKWVAGAPGPGLLAYAWDIDGPLAEMTPRPNVIPFPDGTWPIDATVGDDLRQGLVNSNNSVVNIGVTGGSAPRGTQLIGIPGMWVWGSEGAEIYDPHTRTVRAAPGYEEVQPVIAGIVSDVNYALGGRLATQTRPSDRIVWEPKGSFTGSWHPEYQQSPEAIASGRDAIVDLFQNSANLRRYHDIDVQHLVSPLDPATITGSVYTAHSRDGLPIELLVDGKNQSITIRPQGVSKETALPDAFRYLEPVYDVRFRGGIFLGDGSTDVQAVRGGRAYEAERAAAGDEFRFGAIAVATHRGLDLTLARECEGVALGAGLTRETAAGLLETDKNFARDFKLAGVDPRTLPMVGEVMEVAAKERPTRELKDFERESIQLRSQPGGRDVDEQGRDGREDPGRGSGPGGSGGTHRPPTRPSPGTGGGAARDPQDGATVVAPSQPSDPGRRADGPESGRGTFASRSSARVGAAGSGGGERGAGRTGRLDRLTAEPRTAPAPTPTRPAPGPAAAPRSQINLT